jgi:hypothetical protein
MGGWKRGHDKSCRHKLGVGFEEAQTLEHFASSVRIEWQVVVCFGFR